MKYIRKSSPPGELITWQHTWVKDKSGKPINCAYDEMPSEVREAVKKSLVKEQGGLCCYTGHRVTPETSHIEHLKPQAQCVDHEDTDYGNLLAAYPGPNKSRQEYGAHVKDAWYNKDAFISPLKPDCESRFHFRGNGKITAANTTDQPAITTIQKLSLDHSQLVKLREARIQEILFEENLTTKNIERLVAAMDKPDGNGNFYEFCFAIKQVGLKMLKQRK
jgi:uncharacterized protein (TIGR02646 family)